MKKIVFIASTVMFLVACISTPQQMMESQTSFANILFTQFSKSTEAALATKSEAQIFELTKLEVKKPLKDPDSAIFRNMRLVDYKSTGRIVCGEFNAKNSYGGYVGYKIFAGAPGQAAQQNDGPQFHVNRTVTETCK